MITAKVGSTKVMEAHMSEVIKNGGSFTLIDGKGSVGNIFPDDWYRIKSKLVIKKGCSYFKDGNKLGRRKASLVKPFI